MFHKDRSISICAKLVAQLQRSNRGKAASYKFNSLLEQDLGLAEIQVAKDVEVLSELQVANFIQHTLRGKIPAYINDLSCTRQANKLVISRTPEKDQNIIQTASNISRQYEKFQTLLRQIPNLVTRIEQRQTWMLQLFSDAARSAYQAALVNCADLKPKITICSLGSYNTAPMHDSDYDFLVAYKGKESEKAAHIMLSYFERIIAHTPLECSNMVRICSAGKLECLEATSFDRFGSLAFPKSSVIWRALSNVNYLQGSGDEIFFNCFKEIADRKIFASWSIPADGGKVTNALANLQRQADRNIRRSARLIEKLIANGLLDLRVHFRIKVDVGPDYKQLLDVLEQRLIISHTDQTQITAALRFSRCVSEYLSSFEAEMSSRTYPESIGSTHVRHLLKELEVHQSFACEFLAKAKKLCGVWDMTMRITHEYNKLTKVFGRLKAKYWYAGRQVMLSDRQ